MEPTDHRCLSFMRNKHWALDHLASSQEGLGQRSSDRVLRREQLLNASFPAWVWGSLLLGFFLLHGATVVSASYAEPQLSFQGAEHCWSLPQWGLLRELGLEADAVKERSENAGSSSWRENHTLRRVTVSHQGPPCRPQWNEQHSVKWATKVASGQRTEGCLSHLGPSSSVLSTKTTLIRPLSRKQHVGNEILGLKKHIWINIWKEIARSRGSWQSWAQRQGVEVTQVPGCHVLPGGFLFPHKLALGKSPRGTIRRPWTWCRSQLFWPTAQDEACPHLPRSTSIPPRPSYRGFGDPWPQPQLLARHWLHL